MIPFSAGSAPGPGAFCGSSPGWFWEQGLLCEPAGLETLSGVSHKSHPAVYVREARAWPSREHLVGISPADQDQNITSSLPRAHTHTHALTCTYIHICTYHAYAHTMHTCTHTQAPHCGKMTQVCFDCCELGEGAQP